VGGLYETGFGFRSESHETKPGFRPRFGTLHPVIDAKRHVDGAAAVETNLRAAGSSTRWANPRSTGKEADQRRVKNYGFPIGVARMVRKPTDVWQGTLALMVLKTLETMGPMHGYGLARRIEQTSGDRLSLNYGTLYPALLKLEQEGLAQRTRELGIRIALGATRGRVLGEVMREGASVAAAGIAAGLLLAVALVQVLRQGQLLYEVRALDPIILGGAVATLAVAIAAATAIPARRAVRVDPAVALRPE
jgi:hypothetical protein